MRETLSESELLGFMRDLEPMQQRTVYIEETNEKFRVMKC